jgi:hypothetical protein
MTDVPLRLGFWTIPGLSYQLLTSQKCNSQLTQPQLKLKSKLCYDWLSVGQSFLASSPHLGPKTRFLFLSDSRGFVDVGRRLWREDWSVVYNCCWSSPAHSFPCPSPAGLMTTFYCLRFDTPPTWRATSPYLHTQEQGGPVTPPGTGFAFHRLLRFAGIRRRYSNPPPRGNQIHSQSYFTTGGLPPFSSLGDKPLETHGQ